MKNIRILVLILCACFVSAGLAQQPAGAGSADWTEFHRTNMQRWNPYETVLNVDNVGKLQRKWSYKTGKGEWVTSSPVVASGIVYVTTYQDGNLYALNADTAASSGAVQTLARLMHRRQLWRMEFFMCVFMMAETTA